MNDVSVDLNLWERADTKADVDYSMFQQQARDSIAESILDGELPDAAEWCIEHVVKNDYCSYIAALTCTRFQSDRHDHVEDFREAIRGAVPAWIETPNGQMLLEDRARELVRESAE